MKKISRRSFLAAFGLSGASLALSACSASSSSNSSSVASVSTAETEDAEEGIAQTTAGQVQGTNEDGIFRFLGVPYAEAKERFVPAEDVTPWEGVLSADSYGPIAPQGAMLGGQQGDQTGTDNNCQNLNIWTPGLDDKARPVMVWFHGGGFSNGSANDSGYDGEALARNKDVVVVGVNHRLNVFGYLDLSAYSDKYRQPNVGLTDLIKSLEWVRDNIAAFGGDPDNVTLFGQSGGGAKILALMSAPEAKRLFQKGIIQSGATEATGVHFTTQEASTALTENILKSLNITADNIEDIQTVSGDDLMQAAAQGLQQTAEQLDIRTPLTGDYGMEWEPYIDGTFLPTNPVTDDGFADAGKDVALLIGSNLNEWTGFFPSDPIPVTDELTAALQSAYPDKTDLTAEHVDTSLIRLPLLKIMFHKADQNGASVYAYVFTYGNSYHGAEIPFVFDHPDEAGATNEVKTLVDQVSTAWANFARNGVPSADGLPTWEAYTREGGATMLLDTTSTLVYHHDDALLKLLVPDYEY